jgi:hypothetical protein
MIIIKLFPGSIAFFNLFHQVLPVRAGCRQVRYLAAQLFLQLIIQLAAFRRRRLASRFQARHLSKFFQQWSDEGTVFQIFISRKFVDDVVFRF